MADVFVSYARSDKARVAPLVAAIEAQGWSVWWDPEIEAGQQFDDQIEEELTAAKSVLVVWTPTSVASRWVRGEAREASGPRRAGAGPIRRRAPADGRARHPHHRPRRLGREPGQRTVPGAAQGTRHDDRAAGRPGGNNGAAASSSPSSRIGICVLPFANMSGDPEQEYFSDGISEDVITDLSKVSALAVVSRNSAFMYKGKVVDVPKVARDLKVQYVLEGSVRKSGGRVRITAQLVTARATDNVWAERYDRDLNDIFALQDEISEAIVKALKLKLLPEEKRAIEQRGTTNLDAYNLYLMARQHYATATRATSGATRRS